MVYSQICDWLSDFIDGAAPAELLDAWDCEQWIAESEVMEMFSEFVLPTFKKEETRADAENILKALLWEYYLFRRAATAVAAAVAYDSGLHERLATATAAGELILNSRDFSGILIAGPRRNSVLRRSVRASPVPPATDIYASVIRQIYESVTKSKVHADVGAIFHQGLTTLVDGVVDKGCLLGLQGDLSDEEFYCQMQVQMEMCDVDVTEVCKYKIIEGSAVGAKFSGAFIKEADTVYSPLFIDDNAGLRDWIASLVAAGAADAVVWSIEEFEISKILRNRRWWSAVGLPAYKRFAADFSQASADPMFLAPLPVNFGGSRNSSNSDFGNDRIALFIDEDELYK